ncbi:interleukin-1 receptor-associated kinase 3 isoform X1 [Salvelinus namaycush]|uniref:Interleukin-1 receptor-associated kinase 3 isoform X1 n=1 Tax=Salvelinus namaycush TaxID=8040 RepID=A0A8U0TZF2_SALNM|nr:interleukin-1 receptor-associated kinase 3 isoform X1 [Salvelinus namaycush]
MDSSMYLYDVPPVLIETFCKIIDSGDDSLGWRGLAARIVSSWTEVRRTERLEAIGKSPTRELIWSWAQQNKTVGDLVNVLEDMGHYRALQIFNSQETQYSFPNSGPSNSSRDNPSAPQSPASPPPASESTQPGWNQSNYHVSSEGRNHRLVITYSDVIEGTRHFHQDMKISEGSFSAVYRAVKGHETFAVKLFKQVQKASWRKLWDLFRREMEVHHLYQHPNILELLGCYSDGDRYWLVYPYLPNGSLFHRLHDQNAVPTLSWQERLDIIKGTAKAVHHLHMAQPCTVVCGNITSSNILLDERLQPKLSDFGTARLRPHSVSQSCTVTLDTTFGTLGYLPEEYIRDGKLSVSLDVFSLGVVIMEILTGRKVREETPKHTLLRDVLSGEMEDTGSVDSCLQYLDPRAGLCPHSMSFTLLRLALDCTSTRPRNRPTMENVLQVLSQLLPLPCPPEDQPHTLTDEAPAPPASPAQTGHGPSSNPSPSVPVEDDEHSYPIENPQPAPAQGGPCECSQSEVTYLGSGERSSHLSREGAGERAGLGADEADQSLQTNGEPVDLYGSWPVQCSCSAEVDGLGCEDCRANGFTPCPSDLPQGDLSFSSLSVVDNPVKQRMINKIDLYNRGLLRTEELLSVSMTTQE